MPKDPYDIVPLHKLAQPERAMVRATEDGRHSGPLTPLLTTTVLSAADSSRSYRLHVLLVDPGQPVQILCNCKSGTFRGPSTVCRHAGRVALSLARRGIARWDEEAKTWRMTAKAHKLVQARLAKLLKEAEAEGDPFEGLPQW